MSLGSRIQAAAATVTRPTAEVALLLDPSLADEAAPRRVALGGLPTDDDLAERIEAATITLHFQAVHPATWDRLAASHRADKHGVLPPAFWQAAMIACCTDDDVEDADWETLFGEGEDGGLLTHAQWDEMVEVVYRLNRQRVAIPFTSNGSGSTGNSETN